LGSGVVIERQPTSYLCTLAGDMQCDAQNLCLAGFRATLAAVFLLQSLLALLCGTLLSLAVPAISLWPFALVLVPMFFLVASSEYVRQAFWHGFFFGVGFFGLHVLWLPASFDELTGGMFWFLFPFLILILGVFWGVVTFASRLLGGRGTGTLVLLPALWVLMEWLRTQGTFAFPWGTLGYIWLDTPLAPLASLGGVYLLSLLTTTLAALLTAPLMTGTGNRAHTSNDGTGAVLMPLVVALALLAAGLGYGGHQLSQYLPPVTRTALLVQGSTDPLGRAAGYEDDLEVYLRLTENALRREAEVPDLVIWPEGVVMRQNLMHFSSQDARTRIHEAARGATVITGAATLENGGYYNSAYSLASHQVMDRYDKVYLVPFGESAPFLNVLGPLYRMGFAWAGLHFDRGRPPGELIAPVHTPEGSAAVYICYESVFPQVARPMVAQGAEFLVNISNDAWFGKGRGAEQHFDMGRMRAVETGRYLLRAGNDGITALVDPLGRVHERLPRGPEGTLLVNFGVANHQTPYVQYGEWVILALLIYSAAVVTLRRLFA
jgi:apolipoprotein N-acyltransferase